MRGTQLDRGLPFIELDRDKAWPRERLYAAIYIPPGCLSGPPRVGIASRLR